MHPPCAVAQLGQMLAELRMRAHELARCGAQHPEQLLRTVAQLLRLLRTAGRRALQRAGRLGRVPLQEAFAKVARVLPGSVWPRLSSVYYSMQAAVCNVVSILRHSKVP